MRDDRNLRNDGSLSQNLTPKKTGPFIVVVVKPKTVTIAKDGINETVNIDRVSIARRYDGHEPSLKKRQTVDDTDAYDINTEREYVVHKIVGHSVVNGQILYRVRRYGYFPADNTDEPGKIFRASLSVATRND